MKHLKSLLLSTFALYLLITICGCGKERIVPLYTVSPDFLAYCYFQKGSYWIYEEDSFPGSLDSVYVVASVRDTVREESGLNHYEYEEFRYGYAVRNDQMQIRIFNSGADQFELLMSETDTRQNLFATHLFEIAGKDSIDAWTKITGRFDTLLINRVLYHDLIQVTHRRSTYGNPTREILFAKGVGVVRRSFWDGTTWSLKRYHLN